MLIRDHLSGPSGGSADGDARKPVISSVAFGWPASRA